MSNTSLREKIVLDMKNALKAGDSQKLSILRMIQSECKNKEIESKKSLDNSALTGILRKQIKQYEESILQLQKIGRTEDVENQKKGIQIIQSYLPKPLSAVEIDALIDEAIRHLSAQTPKDFGAVMKYVIEKTGGMADSRVLASALKEKLK